MLPSLLTILLLLCAVAPAQEVPYQRWALHWSGEKGDAYIDQPVCGPLERFTGNPKPFDYDGDLFKHSTTTDRWMT